MNPWLAAGATAVVMSERARHFLRRGVVFGIAGAMNVGDAFAAAAGEFAHGAERVASSGAELAGDLVGEAQETRHGVEEKKRPEPGGRARKPRRAQSKAGSASS